MSEIEFIKCNNCGTVQNQLNKRCKKCKSIDFVQFMCKPKGKIITYTTCNALPESLKKHEKVTFAFIDLDCGGRILGQIWPSESVEIGSKVIGYEDIVSTQPDGTEIISWVFKPE